MEEVYSCISRSVCCIVTCLVVCSNLSIGDHLVCCMPLDFGDANACKTLCFDMLVVELPEVAVSMEGPGSSWLLFRSHELVHIARLRTESLAVGAQMGRAIFGNRHDG